MKKLKTKKDIENDFRVESLHRENDGYNESWWVTLKAGWQWDNNKQHLIHEPTIKEICIQLNSNVQEWKNDPELLEN